MSGINPERLTEAIEFIVAAMYILNDVEKGEDIRAKLYQARKILAEELKSFFRDTEKGKDHERELLGPEK